MDTSPPKLPSVLVVDDLPAAAESLATMLSILGFPARTATSGEAALALAAADPPDVVFTDLGMPGMDGFELARRLRQQAAGESLVVVAVSG
jgi:CheY-like chemotaxis protein